MTRNKRKLSIIHCLGISLVVSYAILYFLLNYAFVPPIPQIQDTVTLERDCVAVYGEVIEELEKGGYVNSVGEYAMKYKSIADLPAYTVSLFDYEPVCAGIQIMTSGGFYPQGYLIICKRYSPDKLTTSVTKGNAIIGKKITQNIYVFKGLKS